MERATTGIQFSAEEQRIFEEWTKEEIYEAYILENKAKEALRVDFNRLSRKIAELRFVLCDTKK